MTDQTQFEFRIFFPIPPATDTVHATDREEALRVYLQSLDSIEHEFSGTAGGVAEDSDETISGSLEKNKYKGERIRMDYIVGGNHWGAKYRGEKQKLEVKYRTHHYEFKGGDVSPPSPAVLEAFKKKDYGKKTIEEMAEKIAEKLFKHCAAEHTEELAAAATAALGRRAVCGMTKWRRHGYNNAGGHRGSVSVESAYLEVDAMTTTGATSGATTEMRSSSAGSRWLSIAAEGTRVHIQECALTSFGKVAIALRAGLQLGLPILVGGYPTFVVNQQMLHDSCSGGGGSSVTADSAAAVQRRLSDQTECVCLLAEFLEAGMRAGGQEALVHSDWGGC